MTNSMPFGDVLEAVDQLSLDEQETLIAILHRRLAQSGRQRLVDEIREAEQEFEDGKCRPMSPEELLREILSRSENSSAWPSDSVVPSSNSAQIEFPAWFSGG